MDEFARLEALQHEVRAEIGQFRAADWLARGEAHDRAVWPNSGEWGRRGYGTVRGKIDFYRNGPVAFQDEIATLASDV
jgi:hypothetical protein